MELVCAFLVGLVMLSVFVAWTAIDDAAKVNSKLREECSRSSRLNHVLDEEEETNRILMVRCMNLEKERDEWKKACEGLQSQWDADGGQVRELRGRILTARAALED